MRDRFLENQSKKKCIQDTINAESQLNGELLMCQFIVQGKFMPVDLGIQIITTQAFISTNIFIVSFGVIMNAVSLFTIRESHPFGRKFNFYLILLCIVDNLSLAAGPGFSIIESLFFIDITVYSELYDMMDFYYNVTKQMQAGLICFCLYKDFVFVRSIGISCSKICFTLLAILILITLNSPVFWLRSLTSRFTPNIVSNTFPVWLHILMSGILSFLIMIPLTMTSCSKCSKSLPKKRSLSRQNTCVKKTSSIESADANSSKIWFLHRLGFVYLLCNIPLLIVDMVVTEDQHKDLTIVTLYKFMKLLNHSNNALIVLIFVSTSAQFRRTIFLTLTTLIVKVKRKVQTRSVGLYPEN